MAEAEIGVFLDHGQIVARVIGGRPGFAALHAVKDLVHDVALQDRGLRGEQIGAVFELLLVLGVEAVAQHRLGNGERVARIVKHQELALVLGVPQAGPALRVFLRDVVLVIDQADRAPGIGDGIGVLRVIGLIAEGLVNVFVVRDVGKVQRLEHILGDQLGDHIVGRDDDVERRTAGFELGVHRLVGIKGQVVDLDAGLLLKGLDHVQTFVRAVGDILAPVIDRDLVGCGVDGQGKGAEQKRERQQEGKDSLFHARALLGCWRFFSDFACSRFMTTIRTRITMNMSVKSA